MKIIQAAPLQATQAAIEAETNQDTYAPPDLLKHAPGGGKAWCAITAPGALEAGSYNIAAINDSPSGDRDVDYTVAFSGTVYAVGGSVNQGGGQNFNATSRTTSDVNILTFNTSHAGADQASHHVWMGDQ
tara:strand:- start:3963 stop:4352 length:390 start_codon:yes stop_codon:yes gene_type:complete